VHVNLTPLASRGGLASAALASLLAHLLSETSVRILEPPV